MNKEKLIAKYSFINVFKGIKKDFYKGNRLHVCLNYLKILIGAMTLAITMCFFFIPASIVSGGASGLSIVIANHFNLDTNLVITILEWVFFFLGYILLGAEFTMKTLLSTIFYPIFLYLFTLLRDNYQELQIQTTENGILVAGLIGGLLMGFSIGITFNGGGSTGGVDCIGIFISKIFNIKTSYITFAVDFVIILLNFFISGLNQTLIGIICAILTATMLDKVYISSSKSYIAFIVSNKYEIINQQINKDLDRGTTLIECEGGYTLNKKKMIQVAFSYDEYDNLKKIVFRNDKSAFMTVTNAAEITGSGFKRLPYKIKKDISKNQKVKIKEDNHDK